jgi:hypothetical protein
LQAIQDFRPFNKQCETTLRDVEKPSWLRAAR